jgi:F0F1-type ATP synthase membrane subunit b/b'
MRLDLKKQSGLLLASSVCAPAVAFAASGHGEPHISHLFWYIINFALFAFAMYFVIRKPFGRFWESRRAGIEAAVNKGEREMQAAKAALMAATEKVSSLTPEYLESVVTEIEASAKEEGVVIVENAKRQVTQIHEHTTQTIVAERSKSESDVRSAVATEVIAKATEQVKRSYNEAQDAERRRVALDGSSTLVQ